MKKYKYNINNLDCANCARELEESLNKNKDFKNVVVNFNTSKLIYESEKDFTIKELNDFVKKVEPDSYIIKEEVNVKKEYHLSILILGIVICLLGYFLKINDNVKLVLYIISYVLLLYRTFLNSIKLLIKSKTINENLLITISCLGAFFTNNVLDRKLKIQTKKSPTTIVKPNSPKIEKSITKKRSAQIISVLMFFLCFCAFCVTAFLPVAFLGVAVFLFAIYVPHFLLV